MKARQIFIFPSEFCPSRPTSHKQCNICFLHLTYLFLTLYPASFWKFEIKNLEKKIEPFLGKKNSANLNKMWIFPKKQFEFQNN